LCSISPGGAAALITLASFLLMVNEGTGQFIRSSFYWAGEMFGAM